MLFFTKENYRQDCSRNFARRKKTVEIDFDSRRQQNELPIFNSTAVDNKKKFKNQHDSCRGENKFSGFLSTCGLAKKNR